jgi:hypothetical protein
MRVDSSPQRTEMIGWAFCEIGHIAGMGLEGAR